METPKTLVTGVREDIEAFVELFKATNSVRFEEFAAIWRQMKFSHIFYGRENERELREFTSEMLVIVRELLLPPHTQLNERICGLYLLYALFFKQPNRSKVKIRMTLSDWGHVMSMVADIREQSHHDTLYVYLRLLRANAFHFVHTWAEMFPQQRTRNDQPVEQKTVRTLEHYRGLRDFMKEGRFDQLKTIDGEYQGMKSKLVSLGVVQNPRMPSGTSGLCLDMVKSDTLDDISKLILNFERKRAQEIEARWAPGRLGKRAGRRAAARATSGEDEDNPQDAARHRIRLKKQAFMQLAEMGKSRRHRQGELDSSTDHGATTSGGEMSSPSPTKKRPKVVGKQPPGQVTPKRGRNPPSAVDSVRVTSLTSPQARLISTALTYQSLPDDISLIQGGTIQPLPGPSGVVSAKRKGRKPTPQASATIPSITKKAVTKKKGVLVGKGKKQEGTPNEIEKGGEVADTPQTSATILSITKKAVANKKRPLVGKSKKQEGTPADIEKGGKVGQIKSGGKSTVGVKGVGNDKGKQKVGFKGKSKVEGKSKSGGKKKSVEGVVNVKVEANTEERNKGVKMGGEADKSEIGDKEVTSPGVGQRRTRSVTPK